MAQSPLRFFFATSTILGAWILACGDSASSAPDLEADAAGPDSGSPGVDATPAVDAAPAPTFSIAGKVLGLRGGGLVLKNGAESLAVGPSLPVEPSPTDGGDASDDDAGDGGTASEDDAGDAGPLTYDFVFPTKTALGATYAVVVDRQPSRLSQTCTVTGGSGQATADVTNVVVDCTTNVFSIGGTITGLKPGSSVTLENQGGPELVVDANGSFSFPAKVLDGSSYSVSIVGSSVAACQLTHGSGTVAGADVTTVNLACIPCGDGFLDSGEECDDGNASNIDACSNSCTKNPTYLGGTGRPFIATALAGLGEPVTEQPPGDMGSVPSAGIFISSNDGLAGGYPSLQSFLDGGGHVLLIGGSGAMDFRNYVEGYVTTTPSATWHQSGCNPTWTKGTAHPITALLPATYTFAAGEPSWHMLHFPSAQVAGAQVLGTTCDTADAGVLVVRTYPSGGTLTYMAFDIGNYDATGLAAGFVRPFLQGYLAYVRSKR